MNGLMEHFDNLQSASNSHGKEQKKNIKSSFFLYTYIPIKIKAHIKIAICSLGNKVNLSWSPDNP